MLSSYLQGWVYPPCNGKSLRPLVSTIFNCHYQKLMTIGKGWDIQEMLWTSTYKQVPVKLVFNNNYLLNRTEQSLKQNTMVLDSVGLGADSYPCCLTPCFLQMMWFSAFIRPGTQTQRLQMGQILSNCCFHTPSPCWETQAPNATVELS